MSATKSIEDLERSSGAMGELRPSDRFSCQPQIVPDTPAEEDLLGPHRRVAAAIAAIVTGQKGGKAIALRGSWGSGKSTVVELLQNALINNTSTDRMQVFVYDAWAHQGDPLRRSFLEQITEFLHEKKWIDRERFREKLDELRRRREHVTTNSTPLLTTYGRLVIASAFLVPFAITIFQLIVSKESAWVDWPIQATLAVLLGILPILLVFGRWGWSRVRGSPGEDGLVGLLWNKTATVNRTTSLRTPEPTSVEFEEFFGSILSAGLARERKLVIVVDNLDRLDRSESLKVWATMRAFFEIDGQRAPWRDSLWLLVPFDATGISRPWHAGIQPLSAAPAVNAYASNRRGEASADADRFVLTEGLSDSFLEKTFQISLDLSEPVLSEWSQFFLTQMQCAFSAHSLADREQVHLLYRHHADARRIRITPRAIKLFLNRLVAIHIQWGHQIPLQTQAGWILYKDEITPEALADGRALDNDTQILLEDQNWPEHFAALHFNIEPEMAAQVLWEPLIRSALKDGDPQSLQRIEAVPVFAQICQRLLSREYRQWTQHEPNSIAFAAAAVADLQFEPGPYSAALWHCLQDGVSRVDKWKPFNEKVARGLVTFLKSIENAQQYRAAAKHLIGTISNSSPEPLQGPRNEIRPSVAPGEWAKGAAVMLAELQGEAADIMEDFRVPAAGEPLDAIEFYWGVLDAVCLLAIQRPQFMEIVQRFAPAVARTEIIGRLFKEFSEQRLANRISTVMAMLRVRDAWPWEPLVSAIDQRLKQTNQPLGNSEAVIELLLVLATGEEKKARDVLQQCATTGLSAYYLNSTRSLDTAAARHIFTILYYWSEPTPKGANVQNAPSGWQFYDTFLRSPSANVISELTGIAERLGVYLEFMERLVSIPQRENVALAMIRSAADREECEHLLTPTFVIERPQIVFKALATGQLDHVFIRLAANSDFLDELMNRRFDQSREMLYLRALETQPGGSSPRYHEFLLNCLAEMDPVTWSSELASGGALLKLLFILHKLQQVRDLGQGFQDALLDHASHALREDSELPEGAFQWQDLLDFLSVQSRTVLLADIRDRLLETQLTILPILTMYGRVLARYSSIWEAKADDVVRRLFRLILDRKLAAEVEWMLEVLRNCREFSFGCSKETRADFLERLERVYANADTEDVTRSLLEEAIEYFRA